MITFDTSAAPERAVAFLRSPAGRAAVRRALETRRLPATLADDLVQEVLQRVWAAVAHDDLTLTNLEGFVTVLLHRSAVDIVRGRVRSPQIARRVDLDPDADGQGGASDPAAPVDVEAEVVAGESLAAVRRALHHGLGIDPALGAAALAYLAVQVDGASAAPDCPRPSGGATPVDAAEWAALWYSGHHECFPVASAAPSAAIRQRRSRLARRFRARLAQAAAHAGLDDQGASDG